MRLEPEDKTCLSAHSTKGHLAVRTLCTPLPCVTTVLLGAVPVMDPHDKVGYLGEVVRVADGACHRAR